MTSFRLLQTFAILLVFISSVFANDDAEWTRIKDDKVDFSILFPSNFLVDNEIEKSFILAPVLSSLPEVIDSFEKPKIIGNRKSVTMSLSVFQLRQVSNAKNYLWYFVGSDTPKNNYQNFQTGDFVGRKTTFDTESILSMSVAIAIKNKVFLINVFAKKEDKKIYEKFVTSLMLNGKALFKSQTSESFEVKQTAFLSDLQTSSEILEVLKRKQEKSEIKIVKTTSTQQDIQSEKNFSRPLIILRKPDFDFIDIASRNNYSGLVKLQINFLATGKIGEIFVVSDSPKDITELAIKSAQKIKFLSAEIDGKKVDVKRTVEYGFNVR